ncbi:hypothetical protein D3C76_777260 [compost metagenome]
MLRRVIGAVQVKQFGVFSQCLETVGEPRRNQQTATVTRLQMLGVPMQKGLGFGAQVYRHIPHFTAQAGDQFGFRRIGILIMQTAHTALLTGAGMVDLTNVKFAAKRTQAALAEQSGEVPALIFEALVLDAEQPGQR